MTPSPLEALQVTNIDCQKGTSQVITYNSPETVSCDKSIVLVTSQAVVHFPYRPLGIYYFQNNLQPVDAKDRRKQVTYPSHIERIHTLLLIAYSRNKMIPKQDRNSAFRDLFNSYDMVVSIPWERNEVQAKFVSFNPPKTLSVPWDVIRIRSLAGLLALPLDPLVNLFDRLDKNQRVFLFLARRPSSLNKFNAGNATALEMVGDGVVFQKTKTPRFYQATRFPRPNPLTDRDAQSSLPPLYYLLIEGEQPTFNDFSRLQTHKGE